MLQSEMNGMKRDYEEENSNNTTRTKSSARINCPEKTSMIFVLWHLIRLYTFTYQVGQMQTDSIMLLTSMFILRALSMKIVPQKDDG